MPNPIEVNAGALLKMMGEHDAEWFSNVDLAKETGLTPRAVNDAIDYLESVGSVDVVRTLGTAPFTFSGVFFNSRGRYIYHEMQSREDQASSEPTPPSPAALPPERPYNPVGSPYGFTEDDWETVALQKSDRETLYVVMGLQFESQFYDTNELTRNVGGLFQKGIDAYNEKYGTTLTLCFEPLTAGYGEHLFNHIARMIIASDIAVFDTSDFNPNVMLEMGIALTWGVRVLPIRNKACPPPPSDVSGQTWLTYEASGRQFNDTELPKRLSQMIFRALGKKR